MGAMEGMGALAAAMEVEGEQAVHGATRICCIPSPGKIEKKFGVDITPNAGEAELGNDMKNATTWRAAWAVILTEFLTPIATSLEAKEETDHHLEEP